MSGPLPILIASWAAFGTIAVLAAIMAIAAIAKLRSDKPAHGNLVGQLLGAAILFCIPISFAAAAGAAASALLLAIGAPPPTYIFIAIASVASFRASVLRSGYGMEGCTKMLGLIASGYAVIWSMVSFEATGGLRALESGTVSLRWAQPFLATMPFAVAALLIAGKGKRTAWLFLGTIAFMSAWMALVFFPVESGFARDWLPRSDWLRFPLAGLAAAAIVSLFPVTMALRAKPNIRRMRLRDLRRNFRLIAAIMIGMGLSWAAARTLIGALSTQAV